MELNLGFRLSSPFTAGIDANNLSRIYTVKPKFQPSQHFPSPSIVPNLQWTRMQVKCAKKAVRKGQKKYPSERRQQRNNATGFDPENRDDGYWRFLKVPVPLGKDPGKDYVAVSNALMEAISRYLKFPVPTMLPQHAFSVVRKSFDARKCLKEPNFVYTVDMDVKELLKLEPRLWDFVLHLRSKPGQLEYIPNQRSPLDIISLLHDCKSSTLAPLNPQVMIKEATEQRLQNNYAKKSNKLSNARIPRVAVVGSGPAGLFASLVLSELGAKVTLIERGQPVERRGRDIGALIVRRQLNCESNLCFGEGGAGTWSDGKLTTRIGKNSDNVQTVGFRIEHPQDVINKIQYSKFADEVQKGRGKVPVADYKLATYVNEDYAQSPFNMQQKSRSCYSFCMCPGGQVVLTSTNPSELCINGMSFSKRSSKWANAAIVVSISSMDFSGFQCYGSLAGVDFQRKVEKEAAIMGGGNYVVPVQTVPDFLENKLSGVSLPSSSYRLGVKAACLHQLFPSHITHALQQSLIMFDKEMPGFISRHALLHGVETRTSAPVRIPRDTHSYESLSLHGLYPVGEGAGYAGGIVSSAVDGLCAAFALAKQLELYEGDLLDSLLEKSQRDIGKGMY